jgi:hypothetical protein
MYERMKTGRSPYVAQFLYGATAVIEPRSSRCRLPPQTHAIGGNMFRRKQIGVVQLAAGAFSAGNP